MKSGKKRERRHRITAADLCDELLSAYPDVTPLDPRFHSEEVLDLLLDLGEDAPLESPEQALICAEIVLEVGEALRHPWLSLCGGLTLARLLAAQGEEHRGRTVLAEAMNLYALVRDERQTLQGYRLEGAARAVLGEIGEAENILEGVRRKHLERCDLAELALTSLDLGAVLAEIGRAEEIDRMAREIAESFTADKAAALAVSMLTNLRAARIRLRKGKDGIDQILEKLEATLDALPMPSPQDSERMAAGEIPVTPEALLAGALAAVLYQLAEASYDIESYFGHTPADLRGGFVDPHLLRYLATPPRSPR